MVPRCDLRDRIPEVDEAVLADRRERLSIGAEGDREDRTGVPFERDPLGAGDVEQAHLLVGACRRQVRAIGRPGERGDRTLRQRQRGGALSVERFPELDVPLRVAGRDLFSRGRKGQRQPAAEARRLLESIDARARHHLPEAKLAVAIRRSEPARVR